MSDKYYVVAGNLREFSEFIKKKAIEIFNQGNTSVSLSNFVYVDSPIKLKGYSNPHGWLVGNWRQQPQILEILQQILISYVTVPAPDNIRKAYNEILQTHSNS